MLKETCNVETAYNMKPEVRCRQGDWLSGHQVKTSHQSGHPYPCRSCAPRSPRPTRSLCAVAPRYGLDHCLLKALLFASLEESIISETLLPPL